MKSIPISVRLDIDVEAKIKEIAAKEQRSVSQVINLKLRKVLKLPK